MKKSAGALGVGVETGFEEIRKMKKNLKKQTQWGAAAALKSKHHSSSRNISGISEEITEEDLVLFRRIISVDLDSLQKARIENPDITYPQQQAVLAVHWHREFVPIDLIKKRIEKLYPNRREELIIPTDHNVIGDYDGKYRGVEVDCYSEEFNQKIQLLIHFRKENEARAGKLSSMLNYTFKYRASQLSDLINTIVKPDEARLEEAARETGADEELIDFVRIVVKKVGRMIEEYYDEIPEFFLKNRILRNYFDALRTEYGDRQINRAQAFLKTVKQIVKTNFTLQYFYKAQEIIEEARAAGACIVIPHPEQFWPVLLADYDVDGIEVWNPQSRTYTDFIISAVNRRNSHLRTGEKRILILMGDDAHLGEKTRHRSQQDREKAEREIGLQPGWEEFSIMKKLIVSNVDKAGVIREYKNRLDA